MLRSWSPRAKGLALLTFLSVARACVTPAPADAQSDEVLTARVCESEIAPRATDRQRADECVQIARATAHRAMLRGRSYRAELMAYSPRATGRRGYGARSWISRLDPDVRPRRVHGETIRVRFAALVVVAWEAVRGIRVASCPRATEWGARWCRRCRERMRAARYERAWCAMSNGWWAAPQAFGAWAGASIAPRSR